MLGKAQFPTTPGFSVARNRSDPYRGSATLVMQKLHELHQYGWEYLRAPRKGRRAALRARVGTSQRATSTFVGRR